MMQTEELIERLSGETPPARALASPGRVGVFAALAMLVYCGLCLLWLGIRPDLAERLRDGFYLLELFLLAALTLSGLGAAVLLRAPDLHQRPRWISAPLVAALLLLGLLLAQTLLLPASLDPSIAFIHGLPCAVCLLLVATLPAFVLMLLIRRGATTKPGRAGLIVLLTTLGLASLVLRLHEANDSLAHLLLWHHLPALGFILLGIHLGRSFLRW